MKFALASLNADKLRELRALLAPAGLELVPLSQFPGARGPDETGSTLEENALLKARAALKLTRLPTIADDTGLEVDALEGRPGVRAARYAGPKATYADNVQKLLGELKGVPAGRRSARFRTVCAACWPDGVEFAAHGLLEGRIALAPRGDHGFGYDPVFEVGETGRTLAELTEAEKNAVSHRARAARWLAALILVKDKD